MILVAAARMAWLVLVWPIGAVIMAMLAIITTPLLLYQIARGIQEGPADRLADAVMPRWNRLMTPWEARRA